MGNRPVFQTFDPCEVALVPSPPPPPTGLLALTLSCLHAASIYEGSFALKRANEDELATITITA